MNFKLRSLVEATLEGSMLMGFGANAMADSTDDILNALIAKGILTEEEGALLQKGRTGEKEAAEAKKKTAVAGKFKDGTIAFESGDGKNSVALTGRMQFDMRSTNANNAPTDGGVGANYAADGDTSRMADQFELRRARIGVKGKFYEYFDYEAVVNAVGSNTNIVDVAYVNAGMFKAAQLKVGQFKQPFNLEEYGTSSNNIDFMERSYINQLTPGKKIGVMLHGVPTAGTTYAGSVFQTNNFGETDSNTDGKGLAGRVTANFAELAGWKDSVLHVGLAGFDTEYGIIPTNTSNTAKTPEQHTRGTVFSIGDEGRGLGTIYRAQIAGDLVGNATTGTPYGYGTRSNTSAKVNNKAYGLEFAGTHGPFKFQTEYMDSKFDANHDNTGNAISADVKAYYVEALWLLTGENYSDWYKNGAWGGIKPATNFNVETGKGIGAWEIGLRYDDFSVGDTSTTNSAVTAAQKNRFQGSTSVQTSDQNYGNTSGAKGGAKTYTAGIKWTLTPNMRVMLNYSHTKLDYAFSPIDVSINGGTTPARIDKVDTVMLRTQYSF